MLIGPFRFHAVFREMKCYSKLGSILNHLYWCVLPWIQPALIANRYFSCSRAIAVQRSASPRPMQGIAWSFIDATRRSEADPLPDTIAASFDSLDTMVCVGWTRALSNSPPLLLWGLRVGPVVLLSTSFSSTALRFPGRQNEIEPVKKQT